MTARKRVTTLFPAALVLILLSSCGSMSRPAPLSTLGMEFSSIASSDKTAPPQDASQFQVEFKGIVMHARFRPSPAEAERERAIIIEGTPMMFHRPMLYVPASVDVAKLRDVTGEAVFCNATECAVLIDDISMRISGKSGGDRKGPPERLPRFSCLVPQMKNDPDIDAGDLKPSVLAPGLPGSFVAGYFELDGGGSLDACPFDLPGKFVRGPNEGESRHFAESVEWSGSTEGDAMLEIRSRLTNGKFAEVPIAHDGMPLEIRVANFPPGNPRDHASPRHFALNRKVLVKPNVPDVQKGADPKDQCAACSEFRLKVAVPGCSDTGWP